MTLSPAAGFDYEIEQEYGKSVSVYGMMKALKSKLMKLDRRAFLASSAAGLAATSRPVWSLIADDPLGVRKDFPAAMNYTYLNSPYTTPPPRQVEQAGVEFACARTTDPLDLGSMLEKRDEARALFAALFGAKAEEVAFLYATSDGENIVASALDWKPGDNVVVDDLHFETSYVLYKTLEKTKGIELRIARSVDGRAGLEHFEPLVDDRTRIVSVSWVSHQNGFRHDLKGLAELAHAHGAYLYADAIQALGMIQTNLHDEGVDFVTSGTYKWLLAAFGVAPFYIREEHLERIAVDRSGWLSIEQPLPEYEFRLHKSALKYEYATPAFGAIYQLAAALKYLTHVGLESIETHTVSLASYMRGALADQGFTVRTPENNASAIVAFDHGVDPRIAISLFAKENIKVTIRDKGTQIRAGVALFNTKADIDHFLDTTKNFVVA